MNLQEQGGSIFRQGIGGMGGSPNTGAECRWEEKDSPINGVGGI